MNRSYISGFYIEHSSHCFPQFLRIDKNENIVRFDAPWPQDGKELSALIEAELAR
jgi:hypothetical protein